MHEYGMGRLPSPPDKRDYLMADAVRVLDKIGAPRPVKTWHSDRVLDQKSTQRCVGYSWSAWGISTPVEDAWNNAMGDSIYAACKIIDREPGAENGSTVRSGAKVMQARKKLATYYFARSIDEAADYVARYGPVVLGTEWYTGMYTPNAAGIMRPTGKLSGGHAYLWIGVDKTYATIRNSWSEKWGKGGDARILLTDLKRLFEAGGEACSASELPILIGVK